MNRKERRELFDTLMRKLNEYSIEVMREDVFIKRPYVHVCIRALLGSNVFVEHGFAKVSYPDQWDEVYGIELATRKAVMDIVRRYAKCTPS